MICGFLLGFIHSFAERPFLNPQERILCSIASVPDKWIFGAGMCTIGRVYRWLGDQIGSQEVALARERNVDPYTLLDEEVATAQKFSELHHGIYQALQENRIYEKEVENSRQT